MVDSDDKRLSLSQADVASIAEGLLSGDLQSEQLRRGRADSAVYRVHSVDGPVVVKLWCRKGPVAQMQRWLRRSSIDHEAGQLARAHRAGVPVPRVYGVERLRGRWTDALLMEDMGVCVTASQRVKQLIGERREAELDELLQRVIQLTVEMIHAGIVDTDHSFMNIVVTESGRPVRLDLEIARSYEDRAVPKSLHAIMLGRLICTFGFAVQPERERAERFARDLMSRALPPPIVVELAQRHVDELLETQRREQGIDMRIDFS